MAEWLALPEVASRSGLAPRPVAWRQGELLTRSRFRDDVARWCQAFSEVEGSRVALYFDDSYEFASALFGAWHAGKEACLPGDAQPATLQRLLPQVQACAGQLPGALNPAQPGDGAADLRPLDLQGTRLVVYTSGSSGEPLAIPKRLAQLDAEMHTLQSAFGARLDAHGPATVYATVSHQHIYGLLFCALWPLAAGRPFVSERIAYPQQMAAQLGGRPTALVSSPAHLKRLPDMLDWQLARGGLQAVFSSGGPLPPEAAQASLKLLGHSPIEVFGSSETGGIAWRQRAVQGDRWTPFPEVECRLEGEALAVRSAHLPDAQWHVTADRARLLDGGGFEMLGRADRIVKIEEQRVSLTAIEAVLAAHSDVAQARVHVLYGEKRPVLAVVAVPSETGWTTLQGLGKRALNERLRAALLQAVDRVALPRRWRYVQAMPVNAQGKTTEALLGELFRPQGPAAQWLPCDDAQHALAELQISPQLAVLDGHFPGQPIVPGVALVDWAAEFARQRFALPPRFVRADALKFLRPVLPGMTLHLALRWDAARGVLRFAYNAGDTAHASGLLAFEASDEASKDKLLPPLGEGRDGGRARGNPTAAGPHPYPPPTGEGAAGQPGGLSISSEDDDV